MVAVMRETLRLAPPASTRSARALEDTTLGGGKYAVPAETPITLHAWAIHRDPLVWGEDVSLNVDDVPSSLSWSDILGQ